MIHNNYYDMSQLRGIIGTIKFSFELLSNCDVSPNLFGLLQALLIIHKTLCHQSN